MSGIHLLKGEKIILKTSPHWLLVFLPIVALFLFWLFYFFIICPLLFKEEIEGFCYLFISFTFIWIISIIYLDWRFNRLYLTNLRIIKERGIIGKLFMSIWLKDIEDIACKYGIFGRIFGFGDLIIESAGPYGRMEFKGMPGPKKIKWMIEKEIALLKNKH